MKDPFAFVENIINEKTIKKAGNVINKIITGILTFTAIVFIISAGVFAVAGLTTAIIFFYFPAILLGLIGIIIGIAALKSKNGLFMKDMSKDHYKDYKTCEDTLKKVKSQLKTDNIQRGEYHHIYDSMKKELAEARIILTKIDNIGATLKNPDCDIDNVNKKIKEEKSKAETNEKFIKSLENHIENIKKLDAHEKKLRDQISGLRFNFNSVYTKLTLIDSHSKANLDDIETDIQKILDFKIEVNKYEDDLLKTV